MKHPSQKQDRSTRMITLIGLLFCFAFSLGSIRAQDLLLTKEAIESTTVCNQFDITLSITGNPPPRPVEVVLIIDRSGSMDDGPSPDPIDFAKDAAIDFVMNLFDPTNNPTGMNRISVVTYGTMASIDIGLTDSTGAAAIIAAINNITTGGRTNIEDSLLKADEVLTTQGTFDCVTSRNIILLTDGVANEQNSGNTTISCDSNVLGTTCQLAAIQAGVDAQTTTVGGEVFQQNVFSIGLFEALVEPYESIATATLDGIQNAGLYITQSEADLGLLYDAILGELAVAAVQLPGESLVTDIITPGFELVPGTINPSVGTVAQNGQELSWFVATVGDETIMLNYSILATGQNVCGMSEPGTSTVDYLDANCQVISQVFDNPIICVPCPDVTPMIARIACTAAIEYAANVDQGGCAIVSESFLWEFYLNSILIGSSDQDEGIFNYTGSDPFIGEFTAELTYDGTYGIGCVLPTVEVDAVIVLAEAAEATIVVDHVACHDEATGNIDVTVIGGEPPYSFMWNTGDTTEDLINVPAGLYVLNIMDASGCSFVLDEEILVDEPATPVSLELIAQMDIVCEGAGSVQIIASGGTPPYTYTLNNGTPQNNGFFNDLTEGTHSVDTVDANGCSETIEFSILANCTDAIDDFVTTDVNITINGNVLDNDEDGEGDAQMVTSAGNFITSQGGSVTLSANGDFSYIPPAGYSGEDAFDYSIADDGIPMATDSAMVYITMGQTGGIPGMSLEKTAVLNDENNNGATDPGETISYKFSVKNTGTSLLFDIELNDPLPGIDVMGGPINVLLPGATDATTFSAEYSITEEDLQNGEVVNQAIAIAKNSGGAIVISDTSDDPNDPTNIDPDNDGEPDDPTIIVLPQVRDVLPFEIFNGISPNEDGKNDFFRVLGIENFPNNNMQVFNRWGVLVFEVDGYGGSTGDQNVFRGVSDGRSTIGSDRELPTGTYFYRLIRIDSDSSDRLVDHGYIYLNR